MYNVSSIPVLYEISCYIGPSYNGTWLYTYCMYPAKLYDKLFSALRQNWRKWPEIMQILNIYLTIYIHLNLQEIQQTRTEHWFIIQSIDEDSNYALDNFWLASGPFFL